MALDKGAHGYLPGNFFIVHPCLDRKFIWWIAVSIYSGYSSISRRSLKRKMGLRWNMSYRGYVFSTRLGTCSKSKFEFELTIRAAICLTVGGAVVALNTLVRISISLFACLSQNGFPASGHRSPYIRHGLVE
jgi:hypothetical protein